MATHALVDERSLARTALALAPSGSEDGFLSPADITGLRLDADLVVLSACRTAGGVTIAGEGVQGLTTPLVAAGARTVVATQWRVGDRSTVRLVADLYDGLARGLTVAEALREAKLVALRRGAPPGEWAGFTVVGDPTTKVRWWDRRRHRWTSTGSRAAARPGRRRLLGPETERPERRARVARRGGADPPLILPGLEVGRGLQHDRGIRRLRLEHHLTGRIPLSRFT